MTPGTKLGPYEILAPIGKGGMGEVWKARDTRLGRDVAIKISAEQFSERFEREARAVAALNHPNICTLYDVGPNYLVMEYIEGATLAERIKEGPIPLEEALGIARHVADALEAAHEKNIIHRDLKPANIKIKPDGSVKVLDFGLAKMGGTPAAKPEDSPTLSMAATQAGMILGTAAYMSPEQARGKEVDKRADIWAFGVVLYEMLTGTRLFQMDDITDTLAAVLRHEPEWEQVPAQVRRLLRKCLEKNPKKRLRDIGDVWELLEETPAALSSPSRSRFSWMGWGIAAIAVVGLAVFAFVHFREAAPRQPSSRFQVQPPGQSGGGQFKLSPDGRYLAIVANDAGGDRLWVRPLDLLQAQPLPGTDGASFPFWSPDSGFIAFFAQGKLKKVAVTGGPPQTLCDAPSGRGGAWNADGVILFAPALTGGLYRVPGAGGVSVAVTQSEKDHRFPEFLPDGRHFLFLCHLCTKPENEGIYVGNLNGTPPVLIVPNDDSPATYVPSTTFGRNGFLLFRRENTLMVQPFDPVKLRPLGEMFPFAEQVGTAGTTQGTAAFSASGSGVLAFGSGGTGGNRELVWLDRAGKRLGVISSPAAINNSAVLSPDENKVAIAISDSQGNADVWLQDLIRGTMSRFTFRPGLNRSPVWSPDGSRVLYVSRSRSGAEDLYLKPASGAGKDELLLNVGTNAFVYDWSHDGKFILYTDFQDKTYYDLWLLPLNGSLKPIPYLQTPFNETLGQFSPDGRWMAYASDESGKWQVYVQPIPPAGAKWQISTAGGSQPRWRHDGKELFYVAADQKLMAVPIKMGGASSLTFEQGAPQSLFEGVTFNVGQYLTFFYQPAADGQRFLVNAPAGGTSSTTPITVVLNWQAALKIK